MTKAEQAWIDAILAYGCAVCRQSGIHSQAEVHHLLTAGKRRQGHLQSIPLCPSHHRGGMNTALCVSRHPWRREFERRYGTEAELLDQVRAAIGFAANSPAAE